MSQLQGKVKLYDLPPMGNFLLFSGHCLYVPVCLCGCPVLGCFRESVGSPAGDGFTVKVPSGTGL